MFIIYLVCLRLCLLCVTTACTTCNLLALCYRPGINGEGGITWGRDDPEYYNDLPGKVPPDLPPPPVPPLPQYSASESKRPVLTSPAPTPAPSASSSSSPVPAPTQPQPIANSHQTLSSKGVLTRPSFLTSRMC